MKSKKNIFASYETKLYCFKKNFEPYEKNNILQINIVEILLLHGANVNYENAYLNTPLIFSCRRLYLDISVIIKRYRYVVNQINNIWYQ